jgi:hypothetical protein
MTLNPRLEVAAMMFVFPYAERKVINTKKSNSTAINTRQAAPRCAGQIDCPLKQLVTEMNDDEGNEGNAL